LVKHKQIPFFHSFSKDVSQVEKPKLFTFPFYYEPHLLSKLAAEQVQDYLKNQNDFEHNFGLPKEKNEKDSAIGKMFGVLVVKTPDEELGFLAAFSGKLANRNEHKFFVPPVFDLLTKDSFFKAEEKELNAINAKIESLKQLPFYQEIKKKKEQLQKESEADLERQKNQIKIEKKRRDQIRLEKFKLLNETEKEKLQLELSESSKKQSILLKKMKKYWKYKLQEIDQEIKEYEVEIDKLKQKRKLKSSALQHKIFNHYSFLNANQKEKSLGTILQDNPPAGAGECAAPKLLQYAYKQNLEPICMAEFWWGTSPQSQIRKHGEYYPACRSKCEPILGHMLVGLNVEENPLLTNPAKGKELEIIYEDSNFAAIVKPAEFLSVPGKTLNDSVLTRAKKLFPNAKGPLLVHRLDMSTSGILLIAKSEKAHKKLQALFIQRKVKKRYVALLNGILKQESGYIDLPLRVDLDNRPHQLVCFKHGKPAQTKWERVSIKNNCTRVHFFPISGRTHQLRVHAAHQLGLNAPILGDDLYGNRADRLYLHAEEIEFTDPFSKKPISIYSPAEF
jgi:tRNA pseudouridine32 synthase/23S rRNA pseudouridine746 synthase